MVKRNSFTREEIVLCIYAARFDVDDIGGIESIHSLRFRSRASIRMKVKNIVAMCDEEGISRNIQNRGLTGLPAGEVGRRTDWDLLAEYAEKTRDELLQECQRLIRVTPRIQTLVPETLPPDERSKEREASPPPAELPFPTKLPEGTENNAGMGLPEWLEPLFSSKMLALQYRSSGRRPLPHDQLRRFLSLMASGGFALHRKSLCEALGLPVIRYAGFVSLLMRLLNVDSVPVVTRDQSGEMIRLNPDLLCHQFSLSKP